MRTKNRFKPGAILIGCMLLVALLPLACVSGPTSDTKAGAAVAMGSAQYWVENCSRCHNIRNPRSYSDSEWDIALMHMRWRSLRTPEQHRAILKLMQSMN